MKCFRFFLAPPIAILMTLLVILGLHGEAAVAAPSSGRPVVAIDAGHQGKGNSAQEPIGPGSAKMKAKVSSGTAGVVTRVPEYQLTLAVAKRLEKELESRGYEVYMIRDSHNVNISNKERAQKAAAAKANILVRIHANGSANSSDKGILLITPTPKSPYVSKLYPKSRLLADDILAKMLKETGANSKGVWETDTMSGINWSTIPVVIVEMGFMSNPTEDRLMQTPAYQEKLTKGMANGIDKYFGR